MTTTSRACQHATRLFLISFGFQSLRQIHGESYPVREHAYYMMRREIEPLLGGRRGQCKRLADSSAESPPSLGLGVNLKFSPIIMITSLSLFLSLRAHQFL